MYLSDAMDEVKMQLRFPGIRKYGSLLILSEKERERERELILSSGGKYSRYVCMYRVFSLLRIDTKWLLGEYSIGWFIGGALALALLLLILLFCDWPSAGRRLKECILIGS